MTGLDRASGPRKIVVMMFGLAGLVLGAGTMAASAATPARQANSVQGGTYQLLNARSAECLAVGGGSRQQGATVIQWGCDGQNKQQWVVDTSNTKVGGDGRTYYHIVNVNSGMCLAVPGGSTAWNLQLIQWPCGSWNDHYWSLDNGTGTQGLMRNYNSSLCMAVGGASLTQGAPVIQWGCNYSAYEQ